MKKILFCIVLFLGATFLKAEEQSLKISVIPKITTYFINGGAYFSDKPIFLMDGVYYYEGTKDKFIVASGEVITPNTISKADKFCVGCKTKDNTPEHLLKYFSSCKLSDKP